MNKIISFVFFFSITICVQSQDWQSFTDSIPTLSSARSVDLNGDNILDIVIGGGTDSTFSSNGVMAFNGLDGSLLWNNSSRDELFGSAIFQDITSDGIDDVIISGRSAQLLAFDGLDGSLIWDYFPYNLNPADSGLFNFYNPQFIRDVDGDNYPDILVSNGGDHSAPDWDSNRPPGYLMVVSSLTGNLIVKAVVPDSAEIYCSPIVADIQNTGENWVLYGTGGENFGGNFYAALLNDLLQGSLVNSIVLSSDLNKGFIAPPAIYKTDSDIYNIIIQSFDGLVTKIDGSTFSPLWTYQKLGTESSAEPVIGNFTGDLTPDVLLVLFKGVAPSYNDYYQVMLDGHDGSVVFLDSLGTINFASANAVDLNNDGRDEGIFSITYFEGGYFKSRIKAIDFTTNLINNLDQTRTGVNIASTPLIDDLDNDGLLDIVYSVKKDSLNPMGWKGIYVYRHELDSIVPNSGIAWGSYLGSNVDGVYNSELADCGSGSVISGANSVTPSCNGYSDGSISVDVVGSSPPYTYLWSNQSISSNIQNLEDGSYWMQVTDSLGCYELRAINLSDPLNISFGGIVSPTCVEDSNGVAVLSSSGCPCMFSGCTFLWENGVTTKNNSYAHVGWNSVVINHVNGCVVVDSVFVDLDTNNIYIDSTSVSSCSNYTWDGIVYNQTGLYTNLYTNFFGCDSIHVLNLTIRDSNVVSTMISACDSYDWNGQIITSSGSYTQILTNSLGCDSTHILTVSINSSEIDSSFVTACDSYDWNGQIITLSGSYTQILTNSLGCDSTHTLTVAVNASNNDSSFVTTCDSYNWDGVVYTQSGFYTNIYSNVLGCDSVEILYLTINNTSDTVMTSLISCDSYSWNGIMYDSSGVYSNLYTNSLGCDSLAFLDLGITNTIVEIIAPLAPNPSDLVGNIISGNAPFTYVWSTGEITSQITPSSNGLYWVIVTDASGCISDTSYFSVEGYPSLLESTSIVDFLVFPNPSNNIFNIQFNSVFMCDIKLTVRNIIGQKVFQENLKSFSGKYSKSIDLKLYNKGVYVLEVKTTQGTINHRLNLY